jgi:glucose/arabinose dehydrogenase
MMRHLGLLCLAFFAAGCSATPERESKIQTVAQAATVPTGFVDESVVTGLSFPTAMEFAPDGRLFICLQGGVVRVVKNGSLLAAPALDLTPQVNSVGERGLLGIAFDPNFAITQRIYVHYTTLPPVHNRVSRFTLNGDSVTGTEGPILDLPPPADQSETIHNGGAIHFGNDGKLYVAVGEHADDTNSQSLNTPFGKMLRINSDGMIPSDNPFFNSTTGISQAIWAVGLRNPYTFDVQRTTGRIFINDVGGASWEEINDGTRGVNYGWPTTEGVPMPPDPRFQAPIYAYGHTAAGECAITGGAFYNPTTPRFPSNFVGDYFFADHCTGTIRSLDPVSLQVAGFATGIVNHPVDLKVGPDGALYYLSHGSTSPGGVGRIRSTATASVPAVGAWGTMLLAAALGFLGLRRQRGRTSG